MCSRPSDSAPHLLSTELRRRGAYLHGQARQTPDPALARALTVRALRLTAEASRLEAEQAATPEAA